MHLRVARHFPLLACLSGLSPANSVAAQLAHETTGPVAIAWERSLDTQMGFAESVRAAVLHGSTIYFAGQSTIADTSSGIYVYGLGDGIVGAIDAATHTLLWQSRYDSASQLVDKYSAIAVSPDGSRVYAGGGSTGTTLGTTPEAFVTAFDAASGAELWHAVAATSAQDVERIAVKPDGSSVYAAHVTVSYYGSGVGVVALDAANGSQVWTSSVYSPSLGGGLSQARSMVTSPGGDRLYLGGFQDGYLGEGVGRVAALETTSGALVWTWFQTHDNVASIALSPDGARLYALHGAYSNGNDVRAFDAQSGTVVWTKFLPSTYPDSVDPVALAVSADGSRVLAGRRKFGTTSEWSVDGLDSSGALLWQQTAPGGALRSFALSPDGALVCMGGQTAAGLPQVAAFGASGTGLLWSATAGSPTTGVTQSGDVVLAGAGAVHLLGSRPGSDGTFDVFTNTYASADGAPQGEHAFAIVSSAGDRMRACATDADGRRLFVLGMAQGGMATLETTALSPQTGAVLWTQSEPASAFIAPPFQNALRVSPAGDRVFALGRLGTELLLVAYDAATGGRLWKATTAITWGPVGSELVISPDGNAIFAALRTDFEHAVRAYDAADGTPLWSYSLPITPSTSPLPRLAMAPDGASLYLAVSLSQGGYLDDRVVALDAATGTVLWTTSFGFEPGTNETVTAAEVSPDGSRLYVSGPVQGAALSSADYYVLALDGATGAIAWAKRYDIAGKSDLADDLAVSPDSQRLYVTGRSEPASSSGGYPVFDWTTLALDAADGAVVWTSALGTSFQDGPSRVRVDRAGSKVYVAGFLGGSSVSPYDSYDQEWAVAGLDAASGAELWRDRFADVAGDEEVARDLWLDPSGTRLYAAGMREGIGTVGGDLHVVAYDLPMLAAAQASVSVGSGGRQVFDLAAGSAHGAAVHLLLGTQSGTSPGIPIGSLVLPLNLDAYLLHTLTAPNQPPLAGSLGVLDAHGHATSFFSLPPLSDPALAGVTVHHAYVVIEGGSVTLASNAVPVALVP